MSVNPTLTGLFAVLGLDEDLSKLDAAIGGQFKTDHLSLSRNQWLIAATGMTTLELSDRLGISDGAVGSAIVISVGSYYGRANPQVWEWMVAKIGRPQNG